MTHQTNTYNKNHPFYASIKERYKLSLPGSQKNTYHIVLDLHNSGIHYNVGDSVAIFPKNDQELVERTLIAMRASGEELVQDKNGALWNLRVYLTEKANITEVSRKLLSELCKRQSHDDKKRQLENLFAEGNKEQLKDYLNVHELWDLLIEHPEVSFSPSELCELLMPLLPRFYSIASSKSVVGEEVHLTVAMVQYHTNHQQRKGVCTHYLCHLAPLNQKVVPLYLQPHNGFTLPEDDDVPIIMIGPGTGVAPFRAFMQERQAKSARGKNWLFFGEWNRSHDFFYEEYWTDLQKQGNLKVDVAFSRDQEHKVYVQHRMQHHGAEIYKWLKDGAYFYVCGDAHRMAKDVDAALYQIIQQHGGHDEDETKSFIKQLKLEKRYLRDVY